MIRKNDPIDRGHRGALGEKDCCEEQKKQQTLIIFLLGSNQILPRLLLLFDAMVKQNEKKTTTRAWQTNPGLHKDFIDECLAQIAKYGYLGTSLVPQSWQRIRDSLRKKHPDVNMGNHKFFKNHWDQLKKKYIAWRYLKSQDGNHFIQESGLFSFSDEQWEYFIQKNRDCAQFRRTPLEYADELSNVFEGILGTGESAVTPCAVTTPLTNNGDHCTSGTSKRKRVENQSEPVLERIANLLERQLERISAVISPGTAGSSLAEHGEGVVEYSLRQCLEMISALRIDLIIPDDIVHLATVKLSQSSQFRKDFMELQDSTHKIWLLSGLALQK